MLLQVKKHYETEIERDKELNLIKKRHKAFIEHIEIQNYTNEKNFLITYNFKKIIDKINELDKKVNG